MLYCGSPSVWYRSYSYTKEPLTPVNNQCFTPNQFQINEAWIVFKLNDMPIGTEEDGDFNFIALMDAASCFILSSTSTPAGAVELSRTESRHLLQEGQARKQQFPRTLFIPDDQPANVLSAEADRQGITVVRVPKNQLLLFIDEARQGFRERFGGGEI